MNAKNILSNYDYDYDSIDHYSGSQQHHPFVSYLWTIG